VMCFFKIGSCEIFARAGIKPQSSWVARSSSMSHWSPAAALNTVFVYFIGPHVTYLHWIGAASSLKIQTLYCIITYIMKPVKTKTQMGNVWKWSFCNAFWKIPVLFYSAYTSRHYYGLTFE
jgi:hypothetical protein